ncbi:UDP-N-acetylmuramate--L-alanine ligase [Carboxydothermus ferrireducens]|uniref:UDP-N-acetylmuramate--L-alanine ligase n=1 Tax=Carboxydothermus ferrireducens DSM 11255 TaxID=1119529 RepID=A0ABX2RFF4_9THEO|nr:UDP-N-acetylmuramate--L-alanine ligase [Carboxydothermus ferrireducens]NYE58783.1 UDP-N-acetylmuramate--alanine ligase [Carboxydothermus ferrireducens DSM 11255]
MLAVHFIAIGGIGMSGLARILQAKGYRVSGSDLKETELTKKLRAEGITVFIGHREENLASDVSLVVVSTAVSQDNPELLKAKRLGIPVMHRGELLARLMQEKKGIAVAGTHGKTTTSSMIAYVLEKEGFDPVIAVGGEIVDLGYNAKAGQGEYMIAEADESDGSFLKLLPYAAVITNIEADHLDYYQSFEEIKKAFKKFADNIRPEGFGVFCWDNLQVREMLKGYKKRKFTYGFSPGSDFMLRDYREEQNQLVANIYYKNTLEGELRLKVPGKHNILNAAAATAVLRNIGLSFKAISERLQEFNGAKRRFQILGERNGALIVDDYAHHPTEVEATLRAAKLYKDRDVLVVFQPHRYTRTHFFYKEFARVLVDAEKVVLTGIYSAGENPIPGVSGEMIAEEMKKLGKNPLYLESLDEVYNYLEQNLKPGLLVLLLGAGNINQVGCKLLGKA